MKTKISYTGLVVSKSKIAGRVLSAIEELGVTVNFSEIARRTGIPVTTVYDFWRKFSESNNIDVNIVVSEKPDKKAKK